METSTRTEMNEAPAHAPASGQQADAAHAGQAHGEPRYFVVWGGLFVLTVVEVLVAFFTGMPKAALIAILLLLALWKALLVALYYMHLRFEPRKLWLLALSPMPLILILIGVVLLEAW